MMKNDTLVESIKQIINYRITFHSFRHSFITYKFMEGKSIEEIMAVTAHANRSTVMKYRRQFETNIQSQNESKVINAA